MNTKLVQAETSDSLILNGLFNPGASDKPAVILIHGFTSDFYTHTFFHQIQQLTEVGVANVAIQTRGTGMRTEFLKVGRHDGTWIGSFYERLEEAHLDISAWIKFLLDQGYSRIILVGHSLGTIKAVRYLFEGEYADRVEKIVLLAPFDKNGYMQNRDGDKWRECVSLAEQAVAEGRGEETVSKEFEDYPVSYQTFVSWYTDSDLSNMWDFYRGDVYDFPILRQIKIPVQIIVGDRDDDFYMPKFSNLEQVKQILTQSISNLDLNIIPGSGHSYVGFETQVADLVKKFIVGD